MITAVYDCVGVLIALLRAVLILAMSCVWRFVFLVTNRADESLNITDFIYAHRYFIQLTGVYQGPVMYNVSNHRATDR